MPIARRTVPRMHTVSRQHHGPAYSNSILIVLAYSIHRVDVEARTLVAGRGRERRGESPAQCDPQCPKLPNPKYMPLLYHRYTVQNSNLPTAQYVGYSEPIYVMDAARAE